MTPRCLIDVELTLRVTKPGRMVFSLAVADRADSEELLFLNSFQTAGPGFVAETVAFEHGTRAHVVDLPQGEFSVRYRAERELGAGQPEKLTSADLVTYTRPSRYCPSDRMGGLAMTRFGSLPSRREQVDAIVRYVSENLAYVVGAGGPNDDAIDSLLEGQGVCRDFAHLCISLCRVVDIPARFVAVYAPGLSPMDFHAVFEAAIDGYWYVFDATHLAPRQSLTRIATGRDAADTAFLATLGSEIEFLGSTVLVTADPELPEDDGLSLIALA
jgi:transglutaminase-like putative cysteine protease